MPLIRSIDHVIHGTGVLYGNRCLTGSGISFVPHTHNGGSLHSHRYGKWLNFRNINAHSHRHGKGIQGRGLPETDVIPTPYNIQLPGGTMKRPRDMSKAEVIRKMAKARHA
jgi:hypothetical protein